MVYLELYLSFVKIGFTSFGGMSMVPLILHEMTAHGWMTAEDLSNLIAIAEMTPGPLGINCATFAGMQTAGVIGGMAAVLGVLAPSYTLAMAVAVFFVKFRESEVVISIMNVVKPVCIGMILDVMLTLSGENYMADSGMDWSAVAIGIMCTWLVLRKKWSVPKVIASAAVLGIVLGL
ncbi:chromate transporter [Lachnospiraceae bacterium 62-35]